MPTITEILTTFDDSAEHRAEIDRFAREYPWEGPIENASFAADTVLAQLTSEIEPRPGAAPRLWWALRDSAAKAKAGAIEQKRDSTADAVRSILDGMWR